MTAEEFQGLSDVPPEAEWFHNIQNPRGRRAYKIDVTEFMRFVGIVTPGEFREVRRSHVIAWRKDLERRKLETSSILAESDLQLAFSLWGNILVKEVV